MEQREVNPAAGEPEISVIIPAHDAAAYISRALDCVAAQEGISPEIIVADDASTDDTVAAVESWGRAHPGVPLRLVRMESQVYALRARLAGLALARARDVIFMDADDTWAGTRRLARVLEKKRKLQCALIHFRATGFLDGKCEGELLWTAPPPFPTLTGGEIFAAYARMEYIPLQLWNKVYSLSLVRHAARLVGDSRIFYFDDKFFVSIVLMCARSWASADEYIYQYHMSAAWPPEKIAKCIHDLLETKNKAEALFPAQGIDAESRHDYLGFIHRRLVYHLGRLSIEVEKELFQDVDPQRVLGRFTPWLPLAEALPALAAGARKNVERILKICRRLHEKY